MKKHPALRKKMLLELHRLRGGHVGSLIEMSELAAELKIGLPEAVIIATQLDGKQWAKLSKSGDGGSLGITQLGVEEAEKMGKPLLSRLAVDYPWVLPTLFSLAASLLTGLLSAYFRSPTPPPVINNIINIPKEWQPKPAEDKPKVKDK